MKTAAAVVTLCLAAAPLAAQTPRDLQGVWDFGILTPLQRPKEAAGKPFFTEAEAKAWEEGVFERFRANRGELEATTSAEHNGVYDDVRPRRVGADRRSSLIVDPPDGLVPPLTAEARARVKARTARQEEHPADGPEDLVLNERCLLWSGGPPLIPAPYNNYLQIVQTGEAVLIVTEMIHDARVVPLDGRPHLPPSIRRWQGDPRGRWEGDTLVVETTNFTTQTSVSGSGPGLKVTERFTLTSQDTLRYQFAVDDPASFARPWSGEYVMNRASGPIYEYACHEANYSMVNILKGARAEEAAKVKQER